MKANLLTLGVLILAIAMFFGHSHEIKVERGKRHLVRRLLGYPFLCSQWRGGNSAVHFQYERRLAHW